MKKVLLDTFVYQPFSYQGVMGRKQYWIAFGVAVVSCFALLLSIYVPSILLFQFDAFDEVSTFEASNWVIAVVAGALTIYLAICMTFAAARRLREAGFKPWLAFVFMAAQLVPVIGAAGLIALVVLCAMPKSKALQEQGGTA